MGTIYVVMGDLYEWSNKQSEYIMEKYNILGGIYSDLELAKKEAAKWAYDISAPTNSRTILKTNIRKYTDHGGDFQFYGCIE
jgi:hypothetical protein